jgi:hypothetical protein
MLTRLTVNDGGFIKACLRLCYTRRGGGVIPRCHYSNRSKGLLRRGLPGAVLAERDPCFGTTPLREGSTEHRLALDTKKATGCGIHVSGTDPTAAEREPGLTTGTSPYDGRADAGLGTSPSHHLSSRL